MRVTVEDKDSRKFSRLPQPASLSSASRSMLCNILRPSLSYGGHSLGSWIEAPLISREVLPETYFLSVVMAADAQAGPFLQFQASCLCESILNLISVAAPLISKI